MSEVTDISYYPIATMAHTPFWSGSHSSYEILGQKYLQSQGIYPTEDPKNCDLFVMQRYPFTNKSFLKHVLKHGTTKPILVWTHEPRFCTLSESHLAGSWYRPDIHIMNVYARNLLLNNFGMYGWAIVGPKLEEATVENCQGFKTAKKPIVGLMRYIENSEKCELVKDNRNIDLLIYRQNLAKAAYDYGIADIYGRGWPENISREISRKGGDWHGRKIEILEDYYFNICLENTNFDYYCTEKLWDAIRGRCLPIYYGKHTSIYEDFPKNSFIDASEFDTYEELLTYIEKMSVNEYCVRLNKCFDVYNKYIEQHDWEEDFNEVMLVTTKKIRSIVKSAN